MREGLKTFASVIGAHTAFAHAAEREMFVRDVQERIVDTASAERDVIEKGSADAFLSRKHV